MSLRLFHLISCAVCFVVTAASFARASNYGLTPVDDIAYVCSPFVSQGLSFASIRQAFTDGSQSIWMPLTYFSYLLDATFHWGFGGMHIQSIFWHALSAVLLYLLLTRLFKSKSAALVATLVWSIHPLRVESVAWIASRKDVLSTFFLLLALLLWIKGERDKWWWIVSAFVALTLGTLAKPSIMVFSIFALAVDFLITGFRKDRRVYYLLIIFFIVVAAEAAHFQKLGGAATYTNVIPLWYKLLNALAAVTVYLGNFLWPDQLAMQCMIRYPDPPRFSIVGTLMLTICAAWLAWKVFPRLRRAREAHDWTHLVEGSSADNAILAGLLIYFSCLVPFLGISGFGIHAFADRFTILPSIGLSIALASILSRLQHKNVAGIASVPIFAILFACTWNQTSFWRDSGVLIRRTLEVDREKNFEMQRALGCHHWLSDHDMEKVYRHLTNSLNYTPTPDIREKMSLSTHLLIDACYATGRKKEAEDYYYWLRKIDYRTNGAEMSAEMMMAEVLWLLNSSRKERLEEAKAVLNKMRERWAEAYTTNYVAYLIARETHEQEAARSALQKLVEFGKTQSFSPCTWAENILKQSK